MEYWITGITAPVALSAVALLGYMIGRSQRRSEPDLRTLARKTRDVHLAADELARISGRLRQNLAAHHSRINKFLAEIHTITDRCDAPHEGQSGPELQQILGPADGLSHEIATAYDELRRHSALLARYHSSPG